MTDITIRKDSVKENTIASLTKAADYWESRCRLLEEKLRYYDKRIAQIKESILQIEDLERDE